MKFVVIYPGRFQPFHPGHKAVYNYLKSEYSEVKIVTTDKVDEKSPFNFDEKAQLMQLAGIPLQDIVQVKSPYTASEVLKNYDGSNTTVVFAISEKDMVEDPRFSFALQKSGKPSYLQPMPENEDDLVPFGDPMKPAKAYVIVVPTHSFWIFNKEINSASQIREMFMNSESWLTQANLIAGVYGDYSLKAHELWQKRLIKPTAYQKSKLNSSMSP